MSSLTALIVFENERTYPKQLSAVWKQFDDLSTGDEWTEHLHNPTLEGDLIDPVLVNDELGSCKGVEELREYLSQKQHH